MFCVGFFRCVFFSFRKAVFHESKASYCGSRVGNFKKGLLRFGKCSGVALSPHRRRSGTMPALIRLGSMGTAGAAMLCWDPEMGSHSLPMLSCVGMFCLDFFCFDSENGYFGKRGACLGSLAGDRFIIWEADCLTEDVFGLDV